MPAVDPVTGRRGGRGGLLALAIAAFALVVALGAVVVALQATSRAKDAEEKADAALARAGNPAGGAPAPAPPPPDPGPGPTATGESPFVPEDRPPDPQAEYAVAYQQDTLTLQSKCGTRYVDLDAPKVGEDSDGYELLFRGKCSGAEAPSVTLAGGAVGSEAPSADGLTPNDCARLLRTASFPNNEAQALRQGVVLCVLTPLAEARDQGIRRKIIIFEVRAVNQVGTASVTVQAWQVPN